MTLQSNPSNPSNLSNSLQSNPSNPLHYTSEEENILSLIEATDKLEEIMNKLKKECISNDKEIEFEGKKYEGKEISLNIDGFQSHLFISNDKINSKEIEDYEKLLSVDKICDILKATNEHLNKNGYSAKLKNYKELGTGDCKPGEYGGYYSGGYDCVEGGCLKDLMGLHGYYHTSQEDNGTYTFLHADGAFFEFRKFNSSNAHLILDLDKI